MFAIVGLGNPGDEYEKSRHNIGWIILRGIVEQYSLPSLTKSAKYAGQLSEGILHGTDIAILFPTGFMNNSGTSVSKFVREHNAQESLVVVHDDVDLPFGEIKISYDRGAGGHNGVKSIIETLKTQKFIRIRIGVARKGFFGGIKRPRGDRLADFVLASFSKSEEKMFPDIVEKVDIALTHILKEGVVYAMQENNR